MIHPIIRIGTFVSIGLCLYVYVGSCLGLLQPNCIEGDEANFYTMLFATTQSGFVLACWFEECWWRLSRRLRMYRQ